MRPHLCRMAAPLPAIIINEQHAFSLTRVRAHGRRSPVAAQGSRGFTLQPSSPACPPASRNAHTSGMRRAGLYDILPTIFAAFNEIVDATDGRIKMVSKCVLGLQAFSYTRAGSNVFFLLFRFW